MSEDTEMSDYIETSDLSQFLPLQNLDEVVLQRNLPAIQPYERPEWKPHGSLELVDLAPAKLASYITKGLKRISGKTTDHLRSLAAPQKKVPISDNHRRRYSVDCSVYSWGKEHLVSEDYTHNPDFEESDEYRKKTVEAVQWEFLFNRDVDPDKNAESTYFETATAPISTENVRSLKRLGIGLGWFTENQVDTSLDILERITNCPKHRIAICRTGMGLGLYKIGAAEGPPPKDSGSGVLQDWEAITERLSQLKEKSREELDDQLKKKCNDKDFILVPISDGYMATHRAGTTQRGSTIFPKKEDVNVADPQPGQQIVGGHWSLLLIDCRSKAVLKGRHFDSLRPASANYHDRQDRVRSVNAKTARTILKGVNVLLCHLRQADPESHAVDFSIDWQCPNQSVHNASGPADGAGACGPFVWEMCKETIQYISDFNGEPKGPGSTTASLGPIELPQRYAEMRDWDSAATERTIYNLVLRECHTRLWLNRNTDWMDGVRAQWLTVGDGKMGWRA